MTIPEEIEQLKIKLEQTSDEIEQAEILLEILKKSSAISNTDTQPYINRLLYLAEVMHIPYYKAHGFNHLGMLKCRLGEYAGSMDASQQALLFFGQLKDQLGIASTYNCIGINYSLQGNYPEALKNHFAALKIREEIDDKAGMAASYSNIGIIHEHRLNYNEAVKKYLAALKIRQEMDDKLGIAASYNVIGNVYFEQGNYSEALKNHLAALELREEGGDKRGIGNSYHNIGNVYIKQGNYAEALKNHFAALEIGKITGDKWGVATYYNNIGVIYEKQGNYNEALKLQLQYMQMCEEMGHKAGIKGASFSLTNVYKATGDFENALKYYEKYHEVEKEILGEESQKQLTNLNFMHNMEQKEKDLEIEQLRNVELKKERDRSENLLLNILPAEVAEELKAKGSADAKLFDNVTVLFTDFKGFTTVSEKLTPQQLVDELHACFSGFDAIISKYNIEKIKTVGDAYLAVSGLPLANPNHAEDMVKAAIEIRDFIANRKNESDAKAPFWGLGAAFEVRIGIHSGSVVAGIVGVKKFAYDIWGDTVNTAARMEQNGEAGKVNISEATYELVKNQFICEYRGEIEAKNKGKLKMYFVI